MHREGGHYLGDEGGGDEEGGGKDEVVRLVGDVGTDSVGSLGEVGTLLVVVGMLLVVVGMLLDVVVVVGCGIDVGVGCPVGLGMGNRSLVLTVVLLIMDELVLGLTRERGGGGGGAIIEETDELATVEVVVSADGTGNRVADSLVWCTDPKTTAATVAKLVAITTPAPASMASRFGRASGSSSS